MKKPKPILQDHIGASEASLCLPEEISEFNRRQMLKTGVSFAAYLSLGKLLGTSTAAAQSTSSGVQRRLIWINMSGGWDILEVTDPKVSSTSGIDMIYGWNEAMALANGDGTKIGRWLPSIASLGKDVLVVRGMAMGTTAHQAGSIYMDTGILSNAGRVNAASIPAIVASESNATIPIIQLNGGSEPQTDRGLLNPVSVVRANNLELYRQMYPTADDQIQRKIKVLDYLKNSITRLQDSVGANDRLTNLDTAEEKIRGQFEANVGSKLTLTAEDRASFVAPSGMRGANFDSFALALKLLKNDLVTCVNLGIGGFDTHANQSARLQPTLQQVDFAIKALVDGLRASGQLDNTLIVLYSDFGRTPKVNGSNGRDHWPVGGALMIGGGIDGGRAIGATDDNLRAVSINPTSGAEDASGTQIDPTYLGGAVLELTLGSAYLKYRPYLQSLPLMTRLKSS